MVDGMFYHSCLCRSVCVCFTAVFITMLSSVSRGQLQSGDSLMQCVPHEYTGECAEGDKSECSRGQTVTILLRALPFSGFLLFLLHLLLPRPLSKSEQTEICRDFESFLP